MAKKKDVDLEQVMAEERSRGRRQPVKAGNLEISRQIRKIIRMIENKECTREDYLTVLRGDLGLKDGSARFRECVKLWDARRGRS
jgi:hypothetical protein